MTTGGYQLSTQVCVDVKRFSIESVVFLLVRITTCLPILNFLFIIRNNSSDEVGITFFWKQFMHSINVPLVLLLA